MSVRPRLSSASMRDSSTSMRAASSRRASSSKNGSSENSASAGPRHSSRAPRSSSAASRWRPAMKAARPSAASASNRQTSRSAGAQEEQREHRSLLALDEAYGGSVRRHVERSQQADVHASAGRVDPAQARPDQFGQLDRQRIGVEVEV